MDVTYLLDTNALSEPDKERPNPAFMRRLQRYDGRLATSSVTIGLRVSGAPSWIARLPQPVIQKPSAATTSRRRSSRQVRSGRISAMWIVIGPVAVGVTRRPSTVQGPSQPTCTVKSRASHGRAAPGPSG